MILLRFTVRNHNSIRDEITIDLTKSSLRTVVLKEGTWAEYVYPLAGIFGPNATGKSAVLDAMNYAFTAIGASSTTWQAEHRMPRAPFRLDNHSVAAPSKYVLEFLYDGRRHEYGFEIDNEGVVSEWLRDAPSRWRTLMERHRGQSHVKVHSSVRALGDVTGRELALSRAFLLKHPQLYPIAAEMTGSFDLVSVRDADREVRLGNIAESLVEGKISPLDIETLLQVADIGISEVTVEEKDLPEFVRRALQLFQRAITKDEGQTVEESPDDDGTISEALEDDDSRQLIRNLMFTHRGESDNCPPFSIKQESDGTIAWLALMVPVIETLRKGGVLCVDEIDSSLHPHLLDVVLGLFADPMLNSRHAQLIFTSHETYILSPMSEIELAPEQVWFTNKSFDGVTDLVCLAEFPRHADANVAKRYLAGRYGGTPRLAPSLLESLFVSEDA